MLLDVKEHFPKWFKAEIGFLCESSKILAKKREISLYGGEEAFLAPEDVISIEDASDAVKRAAITYELCNRLVNDIGSKAQDP